MATVNITNKTIEFEVAPQFGGSVGPMRFNVADPVAFAEVARECFFPVTVVSGPRRGGRGGRGAQRSSQTQERWTTVINRRGRGAQRPAKPPRPSKVVRAEIWYDDAGEVAAPNDARYVFKARLSTDKRVVHRGVLYTWPEGGAASLAELEVAFEREMRRRGASIPKRMTWREKDDTYLLS